MDIREIVDRLNNLTGDAQLKSNTLAELRTQVEETKNNVEKAVQNTAAMVKSFDEAVEFYKSSSQEWWRKFYDLHSSVKVQNEILNLKKRINAAKSELKEYETICDKSYSNDIKTLSSEISSKNQLDSIFKKKIVKAAQKAMCYEVCIYLDRKSWKLKAFDDKSDWGLHLCPNGAKGNRFHYFFILTNPFGYFDLKKALEGAPEYYKRILASQSRILSIIQKHHLKDSSNPVDEMKRNLGNALGKIVEIPVRISNTQKLLEKEEVLYSIVKSGEQEFMQQQFEEINQFNEYRGDYTIEMKRLMSNHPSYKQHQSLLDHLAESVLDFKKVSSHVSPKRNQLKVQLLAEEKAIKDKLDAVNGQIILVQKELDTIAKEMEKLSALCNEELKKSTDTLDGDTLFELARMYYEGKGLGKDFVKALQLFTNSYDKGNSMAAIYLGEIYHEGNGVEQDYAMAYRYFSEASKNGYIYATKELAGMYLNGEYVKEDAVEATRLFQIAADGGETFAAAEVGYSYFSGRGTEVDYEKAYNYLKVAMDGGDLWAVKFLARMYKQGLYVKKDDNEAFRLFKITADQSNDLEGIEQVASSYYNAKSYEQAYEYLSIAYKMGSAFAARVLAYMYEEGYYLNQDINKAFMLAKEAAEKGDANACESLGVYYDNGKGTEKDYEKAFLYLKKASDAGISHATANLGIMYRNGHFVKKDYHEAFRLFEKAAKENSAWGYYNMAESYRYGYGLKRNLKKAEQLYCVAASLGLEEAEKSVKELNANLNNHSEIIELGKEYIKDFIKDRIEDFLSDLISDAVDQMLDEEGSVIGEFVGDALAHGIMAAFDN